MKKNIIAIAIISLLAVSVSSCKKTYECHCDKVGGGDEHFDIKNTESKADEECHAKAEGSTVYEDCHIE